MSEPVHYKLLDEILNFLLNKLEATRKVGRELLPCMQQLFQYFSIQHVNRSRMHCFLLGPWSERSMIKIEKISMTNFRGSKKFTVDLNETYLAIFGQNRSGKRGIIDAIYFAFTGFISKLIGPDAAGLTVNTHDHLLDVKDDHEKEFLPITSYFPEIYKTA